MKREDLRIMAIILMSLALITMCGALLVESVMENSYTLSFVMACVIFIAAKYMNDRINDYTHNL